MTKRRMQLPVVQGQADPRRASTPPGMDARVDAGTDPGAGARAGDGLQPDQARLAEGWEHRFVATGDRVTEMTALYQELGYEVLAQEVSPAGLDLGCAACFSGQLSYTSIYTRRPSAPEATADASPEESDR